MTESSPASKKPFRAGFLIHDVSRLRRTAVDQRLKPLGVTRSQWWALVNLARSEQHAPDGISQVELARLLDVGKVTVTGLIDRLEESGLVQRIADPQDRRSKLVRMSAKGRSLQQRLESVGARINQQIMDSIAPAEMERLIGILSKMKHNLIALDAVTGSPDDAPADSAIGRGKPRRAVSPAPARSQSKARPRAPKTIVQ